MRSPAPPAPRGPLASLCAAATIFLVGLGCPPLSTPELGEVPFGDFMVTATFRDGGCEIEPGEPFSFSASLSADLPKEDGGVDAWVVLDQGAGPLAPRPGEVQAPTFVFRSQQQQQLGGCACPVNVTEVLRFEPLAAAPDGGVADGGGADGGTADGGALDGGADAGTPDGGLDPDGGIDAGLTPPIPGLPHPDAVDRLQGEIEYLLEDPGGCGAPDAGCVLPCSFSYETTGPRG